MDPNTRGYNYRTDDIRPIEGVSDLVSVNNRHLYRWWISFQPEMPSRRDFDIIDHLQLAPYIFLIEVLGDGGFRFKLRGDVVFTMLDMSNHLKTIRVDGSEDTPLEREYCSLARYYDSIIKDPYPRRCRGRLLTEKYGASHFESIDCPLKDGNGSVSHLIGCINTIKNSPL